MLLVAEGRVAGFVRDTTAERADTGPMRAVTAPETPSGRARAEDREPGRAARDDVHDEAREGSREAKGPGLLRRLLGRKRAP